MPRPCARVVAIVDFAGEAARGADAVGDRVMALEAIAAAAEHLVERDFDRNRLDALDIHRLYSARPNATAA
jgi:hypothetical protein